MIIMTCLMNIRQTKLPISASVFWRDLPTQSCRYRQLVGAFSRVADIGNFCSQATFWRDWSLGYVYIYIYVISYHIHAHACCSMSWIMTITLMPHIHKHIYIYTHIYMYIYIYIHTCMFVCIYIYIYIYIYTYICYISYWRCVCVCACVYVYHTYADVIWTHTLYTHAMIPLKRVHIQYIVTLHRARIQLTN